MLNPMKKALLQGRQIVKFGMYLIEWLACKSTLLNIHKHVGG